MPQICETQFYKSALILHQFILLHACMHQCVPDWVCSSNTMLTEMSCLNKSKQTASLRNFVKNICVYGVCVYRKKNLCHSCTLFFVMWLIYENSWEHDLKITELYSLLHFYSIKNLLFINNILILAFGLYI